jgi:predicted dehydrogenase
VSLKHPPEPRQPGDELRVALIGVGLIANSAHMPAWREHPGATVTWAADNRPEAVTQTCEAWHIPDGTTDWRSLLERDDIDAVDICLPALLHEEATVAFLERGVHVLVEKPVALTLEATARMREAQEASGATLMVAENWPYSSAYRRVREIMDSGDGWKPFLIQGRHESALRLPRPGADRDVADSSRVGYLFGAGIHTLNLSRLLSGEMQQVAGFATPAARGDYGLLESDSVLAVRFDDGAIGSFAFTGRSRHVGPRRLGFRLTSERGVIDFDILSGHVEVTSEGIRTHVEPGAPSMGYPEEIAHFVDCVRGRSEPITSIQDQERTLRTLFSAYSALESGLAVSPADVHSGSR